MKSMYKFFKTVLMICLLITLGTSCKKFLDVGVPKTELPTALVFADESTAINAITSIYGDMMSNNNNFVSNYCSSYLAYTADEMIAVGSPISPYYTNALTSANDDFWGKGYEYIFQANAILLGVEQSEKLTEPVKKQLTGEALFIRAFCHFYMVNLFGDVPYITSTDFRVNNKVFREPVAQVYGKILKDLEDANAIINTNYLNENNLPYADQTRIERIRPNKAVVTALMARVYLYMGNWQKAEELATTLIGDPRYSLPADISKVFLKNSTETIWQLQPSVATNLNGWSGPNYIIVGGFFAKPGLTLELWNAPDPNDKRKTIWMGTFGTQHYAYKYRVVDTNVPSTEYYMVFRLAEQYLIRAEARAHRGNIEGAVTDLNLLRARARTNPTDLPDYEKTITDEECLKDVAYERRIELFTEWGHRWLDLKRTGKADEVLAPLKGDTQWQTTDQLFPLPQNQINLNPNMRNAQNPGYNL